MPKELKPTQVIIRNCRLSYATVWEPKKDDKGNVKYSVSLLIPKTDTETRAQINAAIKAAIVAGEKQLKDKNGNMPVKPITTIHDGDEPMPKGGSYGPEASGCYVLNTSSTGKPQIVDRNPNIPITDQSRIYSGCYCNVSVNFYAYNREGNRGIGCGLGNIQFVKDGEPLGGRTRAEDDFDSVEAAEPDGDFL